MAGKYPSVLVSAVWPATAAGNYSCHEDDGGANAYQGGDFVTTTASFAGRASIAAFDSVRGEGSYSEVADRRAHVCVGTAACPGTNFRAVCAPAADIRFSESRIFYQKQYFLASIGTVSSRYVHVQPS